MTLKTDNTDMLNTPISVTDESHTIVSNYNDWGAGFKVRGIPYLVNTADPTDVANGLSATIDDVSATFVLATPSAGQIRMYVVGDKIGYCECHSDDVDGEVSITYKSQGNLLDSRVINETNIQVNTNTTNISAIDSRVTTAEGNITTLQGNVSDHESRIGVLEEGGTGSGVTPVLTFTPINDASGKATDETVYVDANKWYDDESTLTDKIKPYPTATDRTNDTNAIAINLSRSANKRITITPSTSWPDNTQLFWRALSTLPFADGTTLESNNDWSFVVGTTSNLAPSATVQAITGTTTIGSTLTGHYTFSDDNPGDTEGTSTYRWLRNGVAIGGATSITYVLVEADLGKTITFEVTPVDNHEVAGSPATSAGLAIPVPAPPSLNTPSVSSGKITCTFTANSTLSTESYNAYYTTDDSDPITSSTKLTGVTSPFDVPTVADNELNGSTIKVKLEMVVNSEASALSAVVGGVPVNTVPTLSSLDLTLASVTGYTAECDYTDANSDPCTGADLLISATDYDISTQQADITTAFGSAEADYKRAITQQVDIDAFTGAGLAIDGLSLAAGTYYGYARATDAYGTGLWVKSSAFATHAFLDPSFESGTFVADPTLGWVNASAASGNGETEECTFITANPTPSNETYALKMKSISIAGTSGNTNIKQIIPSNRKELLANFAVDFMVISAETDASFAYDSGGIIVRILLTPMDSVGASIGGTVTSIMLWGGGTTGYYAYGDYTYRTNITKDQWVTKTIDLKQWIIDHLASGKTWADVNTVDILFINFANSNSPNKAITTAVDNIRG